VARDDLVLHPPLAADGIDRTIHPMGTTGKCPTAAVATPNPTAAAAGRDILVRGGNAVDAAVAAMLACCVAEPAMVGIGGYGGSMVAFLTNLGGPPLGGSTVAIDFDSRAPLGYQPVAFGSDRSHYDGGPLSITVPAVVAGLDLARSRFGTLAWSTVSEPAIALAENGVPVTDDWHQQLANWAKKTDPISRQALFPDGRVPLVGGTWVQTDLARLLRRLSAEGPAAFYHGEIPRTIVRQVQDRGGILTVEDFKRYQPTIVEPLAIDYRGHRILTPPPPSGGLTTLQILRVLEQFDLSKLSPCGTDFFHLTAEAAKLCWRDRSEFLGDPDVTPIPVGRMLSTEVALEKAARIRRDGIVAGERNCVSAPSPHHTVNVLAADVAGNVASITATHGHLFGSSVAIDGLGLVMNHGMSRFDLAPGSPNAAAAGKRMFHNMAPTILLGRDGKAFGAVGLAGGPKIVTVTAQIVASLVDFAAAPAAAVTAGRIHCEADEPVAVSSAVPESVIEEMRALGHTVRRGQDVGGPPAEIGGVANALVIDPKTGAVSAASKAGKEAALTVDLGSASQA
jgi:gamma-glutamyltranspeptidase/glutathione hydrolase